MTKMKVNFYCVGAQKAGTTTLHDILAQHPDIYVPKIKETHFFDIDENYKKGLDWYWQTHFSDYQGQKACGSCDPEYMFFEKVPKRILASHGENVKLIFILRNPIKRAFSHYLMTKRRLMEKETFETAITLETERMQQDFMTQLHFSYISRGFYSEQIKRFQALFPSENFLFIRFEKDFLDNTPDTILSVLEFLEVQEIILNTSKKSNSAQQARNQIAQKLIYDRGKLLKQVTSRLPSGIKKLGRSGLMKLAFREGANEQLDSNVAKHLKAIYKGDIEETQRLIGKDVSYWLE